ncbi:MAG: extracellular solute-binding protein [Candidatus Thermoplasmatota archaeon]|nr:extracellular solute-binding protein [Candidatus Thermoplasmatota archaeon]
MAVTRKWWIVIGIVIVVVAAGSIAGYELTKRPATKNIVLYTWWATTGKVALQHEIPAFEKAYPGYTVSTEITPGGGGYNSIATVLSLIEAGKPPDAFQAHMGPMMYSYVSADSKGIGGFVNWTSYYKDNLSGHVIPAAFEAGSMNGVLLSMPVEVHTMGLLYINQAVLHRYGLPIPTNVWMLQNDTNALVSKGFNNATEAPWGISANEGGWAQMQLWENNFLGLAGTKLYNEFTYGTLNTSNATVSHLISQANGLFLNESKYDYPGWQTMSWTQMASELIGGHVAFLTAGDFVTNYMYDYYNTTSYPAISPYINNTSTPVLVESFPSTQSYFVVNLDSVGIPTGPTAAAGTLFVKYWTSPAGNKIWTQWKGISYYNNVTTNYYNTPEQWYMYEKLVHTNTSDFVYALSDGGLFNSPFTTLTGNLLTLQESGGSSSKLSSWNSQIVSQVGVEKSTWLSANNLSLGYLGFPGAPFGGYLPPWANSTYNLTGSGSHAVSGYSLHYSSSQAPTQVSPTNSVRDTPSVEVAQIGTPSFPVANIDFKAVVIINFKLN